MGTGLARRTGRSRSRRLGRRGCSHCRERRCIALWPGVCWTVHLRGRRQTTCCTICIDLVSSIPSHTLLAHTYMLKIVPVWGGGSVLKVEGSCCGRAGLLLRLMILVFFTFWTVPSAAGTRAVSAGWEVSSKGKGPVGPSSSSAIMTE